MWPQFDRRPNTQQNSIRRAYRGNVGACVFVLALAGGTALEAQTKPAKNPASAKGAEAASTPPELKGLDFSTGDSVDLSDSAPIVDKDETPEGRQRIREVVGRAREIFRERDAVERERRPLAGPRDVMLGEVLQAQQRSNQATAVIADANRQLPTLQSKLRTAGNAGARQNIQATINQLRVNITAANNQIAADKALIDDKTPDINALNLQIKPLDERLSKLWAELNECRKQWLELRQPIEKYTRGEYELLRRVLDDWLVMDGLWPEAFAWAALCAYEMDEIDDAAEYLEKAQKLRVEVFQSKRAWSQLEALSGMIRRRQPGQSSQATRDLGNANTLADKNADWETYFLLGRCYAERQNDGSRAKAHLEHALKIKPNCLCAKLWYARLQTISTQKNVRDVAAGLKTLERLWEKTGKRSWRLAYFLVVAYDAAGRRADADTLWKVVDNLAPVEHKERLNLDRKKSMELNATVTTG